MKQVMFKNKSFGKVESFLNNIAVELPIEVENYFNDTRENPFRFREKAFTTILFPVLQRSCKRVTMELNYKTLDGKKDNFLDFHCLESPVVEGESQYLLEFKHTWGAGKCKKTIDKWNDVNCQIQNITKENIGDEFFDIDETYAISLMLFVLNKNETESLEGFDSLIKEKFKGYDYRYDWEIPQELNDRFKSEHYSLEMLETLKISMLGKVRKI